MTLPRSAAQVLSGHVTLEIRCIDRILLTFRQPRLQYGKGIHGFFCHHRGNQFVSSALMHPMTEAFAADIHHYIGARNLDLIRFAKGESKDKIARGYLAGHNGGEQILFAGVAQEKTRIWRTRQRTDKVTGRPYPWLCQEQAMVNHWYFYGFDADFGPFYIKFCGYFPFTGQIYLNGHEYAMRQCAKAGIAFTALDNAFGSAADPAAVQRICDGLTDQEIYRFAGKWLARLPHPFTTADEQADYRWQLSVQQVEFSTTMALDRCCRPRCLHMVWQRLMCMFRQGLGGDAGLAARSGRGAAVVVAEEAGECCDGLLQERVELGLLVAGALGAECADVPVPLGGGVVPVFGGLPAGLVSGPPPAQRLGSGDGGGGGLARGWGGVSRG